MKDIPKWTILAIILILFGQVTAQKTKIQVTFQIVKGSEFYNKYAPDSLQIKQEGLRILINGLHEYLPFIDFTSDKAPNKLAIRLDKKYTGIIQETYFFLTFIDSLNKTVKVEWKFLSSGDLIGLNYGATGALPRIQQVWMDLLKDNYNNVLVQKMFNEVPIKLYSKEYYLKLEDQYELVLPFKKRDINLSTFGTEFTVVILGKLQNFDKKVPQSHLSYAGDVVKDMGMDPALNGCIRIGLNQFTLNKITGGEVFFLSYRRDTQNGIHENL